MFVCMYAMYVCMYVCLYVCMPCTYACVYVYICARMYLLVCSCVYLSVLSYIHICIHLSYVEPLLLQVYTHPAQLAGAVLLGLPRCGSLCRARRPDTAGRRWTDRDSYHCLGSQKTLTLPVQVSRCKVSTTISAPQTETMRVAWCTLGIVPLGLGVLKKKALGI